MSNRDEDAPTFKEIGRRLMLLRRILGLTQVDMAAKMGIQTSRWNNWEMGVSQIQPSEALRLKRLIPGVTTDWIYGGDASGITLSLAEQIDTVAKEPAPEKRRGRPSSKH